jgi:hypothetical protein
LGVDPSASFHHASVFIAKEKAVIGTSLVNPDCAQQVRMLLCCWELEIMFLWMNPFSLVFLTNIKSSFLPGPE